jgi:hypothetical protein
MTEEKPKPDTLGGANALLATTAPQPTEKSDAEKRPDHSVKRQKTCPKCPGSPAMNVTAVIGIIPAMNDDRFPNIEKISRTSGFPVQVYECPQCHLVELYRPE